MLINLFGGINTLEPISNEHSLFKNNTCKNNNHRLKSIEYLEIQCALLYIENIYFDGQRISKIFGKSNILYNY